MAVAAKLYRTQQNCFFNSFFFNKDISVTPEGFDVKLSV